MPEENQQSTTGEQPGAHPPQADSFKSEESKQAVLADLAKERDARQALEAEVKDLKSAKTVLDKLSEVFSKDGAKPQPTEIPDWAREIMARNEAHDKADRQVALAKAVAKESEIKDAEDIDLLALQPDEASMRVLAARLKNAGPASPRNDPSAGRSGEKAEGTVQSGRDLYAERHPKN